MTTAENNQLHLESRKVCLLRNLTEVLGNNLNVNQAESFSTWWWNGKHSKMPRSLVRNIAPRTTITTYAPSRSFMLIKDWCSLLTVAEIGYLHTQNKGLALFWAMHHFHMPFSLKFRAVTDDKTILFIINPNTSVVSSSTAIIQRSIALTACKEILMMMSYLNHMLSILNWKIWIGFALTR